MIETQPELKKKYEEYFVAAFLESYFYYMGKAQYREGKEFLTSVLKYYPDNEEMLSRMKFVNSMLK